MATRKRRLNLKTEAESFLKKREAGNRKVRRQFGKQAAKLGITLPDIPLPDLSNVGPRDRRPGAALLGEAQQTLRVISSASLVLSTLLQVVNAKSQLSKGYGARKGFRAKPIGPLDLAAGPQMEEFPEGESIEQGRCADPPNGCGLPMAWHPKPDYWPCPVGAIEGRGVMLSAKPDE